MASIDPRRVAARVGVPLLFALAACGCTRKVEFAEVTGTVTLNNQPLAGVGVAFFPQGEGVDSHLVARATTDESGRYTLVGPDGQPAAVVGTNRVTVLPPPTPRSRNDPRPPPSLPVPPKYNTLKLTPLVKDVMAGGPQTIDLALTND
jgi:hypothetical protein